MEKAKVLAPSTVLMVDAQKRKFLKKYFPRKPDAVANMSCDGFFIFGPS
jgi:hypothetical protein